MFQKKRQGIVRDITVSRINNQENFHKIEFYLPSTVLEVLS